MRSIFHRFTSRRAPTGPTTFFPLPELPIELQVEILRYLDVVDVFERDVCEVQSPTCNGVRSSLDARLVGLGLRVGGPGEVDDAAPAGSAKLESALYGRGFAGRKLSGRFGGVEEDVALVRGCCSGDQGG